jgi:hypothetical protein
MKQQYGNNTNELLLLYFGNPLVTEVVSYTENMSLVLSLVSLVGMSIHVWWISR